MISLISNSSSQANSIYFDREARSRVSYLELIRCKPKLSDFIMKLLSSVLVEVSNAGIWKFSS